MFAVWRMDDPVPATTVLLLEYCDLGILADYRNGSRASKELAEEGLVWHTTFSMSQAVAYLHCGYQIGGNKGKPSRSREYAIVHQDNKPQNVLLKFDANAPFSLCVKLGDFGLTYKHVFWSSGTSSMYVGGTCDWQPAESLGFTYQTEPAQNMWVVGAIIHYL